MFSPLILFHAADWLDARGMRKLAAWLERINYRLAARDFGARPRAGSGAVREEPVAS